MCHPRGIAPDMGARGDVQVGVITLCELFFNDPSFNMLGKSPLKDT